MHREPGRVMVTWPSFLARIHDGGRSVSGLPPHVDALAVDGGVYGGNRLSRKAAGKTRPQRHMRAARIVVPDPLMQKSSQMIVC